MADRSVPVLIRAACPHIAHNLPAVKVISKNSGDELPLLERVFTLPACPVRRVQCDYDPAQAYKWYKMMGAAQYYILPDDPLVALNILREAAGLDPLPEDEAT